MYGVEYIREQIPAIDIAVEKFSGILEQARGSLPPWAARIPTWVYVTIPTVGLVYMYLKSSKNYFKKKGIPGPPSTIIVGETFKMLKAGFGEYDVMMKKRYGKVFGTHMFGFPQLTVFDLDILRDITIKDFQHFQNHTNRGIDIYLTRKMLTALEFDHWKHVRNMITPTFTGGKLRRMNKSINHCCRLWIEHLEPSAEKGEIIELHGLAKNLTMNLIASVAFGIQLDSHPDERSDFQKHAEIFIYNKFTFTLAMYFLAPRLMQFLGVKLFPDESVQFFMNAIEQAMEGSAESGASAARDFLEMMVPINNGDPTEKDLASSPDLVKSNLGHVYSKSGLTREEILASGLFFFLAGYETVSTGLSFLLYNLACNPDIQDKLYTEITDKMEGKDEPDYDVIKEMAYLQMCLDESLRLYSPSRSGRQCNETVDIRGLRIEKGMNVVLPIYAIHRDPDIYPEPEEFIPERFTAEAKAARHPMAYLPFGQGPRMCIGNRLALMEIKFAAIHVLTNFKVLTCEETQIPIEIDTVRIRAKKGIKLKLEKR